MSMPRQSYKHWRDWQRSYEGPLMFGWTEAMASFVAALCTATNCGLHGQALLEFGNRHAPDPRLAQPTHQVREPFRADWEWIWM